jgi:hypothetical protein
MEIQLFSSVSFSLVKETGTIIISFILSVSFHTLLWTQLINVEVSIQVNIINASQLRFERKKYKENTQPMAKIFLFKKIINILFFSLLNFRKWSIEIQTYASKKKERESEIGKERQTEWNKES